MKEDDHGRARSALGHEDVELVLVVSVVGASKVVHVACGHNALEILEGGRGLL